MATIATTKKSTKGRKSAAIALAIVGVAGLTLASAAQLTVNSSSLGAGASVVASCDTDGITVGYSTTYNTTNHVYDINGLNLSGVNTACNNLKYSVQLTQGGITVNGVTTPVTDISGSSVTGVTTPVTTLTTPGAGTATIAVPATDASIVTGVAIVIYN